MYWREKKNELYRIQNIVKALLRNNTCERLLKYTYNLLRKENFQSKAHLKTHCMRLIIGQNPFD